MTSVGGFIKRLASRYGSSFRRKVLAVAIPGLILASVVYTVDAVRTERAIMRQEIKKRAEVLAHLASRIGELPLLSRNPELIKSAIQPLKEIPEVSFVAFYDREMVLLTKEGNVYSAPKKVSPDLPVLIFEDTDYFDLYAAVYTIRYKDDIAMYEEMAPSDGIRENEGWVRVGFSKSAMVKAEHAIIVRGLLFALVLTVLIGGIVSVLFAFATKPLSALTKAMNGIRVGEYPEIRIKTGDEIGILAAEYNKMAFAVKDREQRLIQSEKRYRELFERVEHAIFRLDTEGAIVETNRKFEELCGSQARFSTLLSNGYARQCMEKSLIGHLKNSEERLTAHDGKEVVVLMSLYPDYDESATLLGYDGHFVDITEKKRLEQTLIQAQKLDSLGLLAGGIAHDFNNILTGILGYASLIKMMVPETEPIHKHMDAVEKSARRASNLAGQLLGFARKGKYKVENIPINSVVKELADFLKETFDRGISILLNMEDNSPFVEGDSTQIYQALLNLCINARDAMPEGGRLTITTELTTLTAEKIVDFFRIPPGEYVHVSVSDTGTGMAAEIKKKIFDPFFTTKEVGKGTGLGLAMVYGIIKNHSGYIDVYSETDKGTEVAIYLPMVMGKKTEPKTEPRETFDSKGMVLIIDDEEVIRKLAKDILELYSYKVFTAGNGIEGVSLFAENKENIDLVILDMVMPEKSGRQTFKELRAIRPDIKVLLCSGYGREQYFHELFEAGAAGFLQKPFQHSDILTKVGEAMGK